MFKTVLVVDDELDLRAVVIGFLGDDIQEVFFAACGNDAIKLLKGNQIDLVISDVNMPSGTGIDLLKTVQAMDAPKPKIIMMSALLDPSLFKPLLELGAVAVLSKPFTASELREAINVALLTGLNLSSH